MDFKLYVSDDSLSYISCIVCLCESSSQVIDNWNAIQSYVSGHYQPPGALGIWNIYLAFVCTEKLPLWEKYQIENDKYAVRKIVLDDQQILPSPIQVIEVLSQHLLGSDLVLDESVVEVDQSTFTL